MTAVVATLLGRLDDEGCSSGWFGHTFRLLHFESFFTIHNSVNNEIYYPFLLFITREMLSMHEYPQFATYHRFWYVNMYMLFFIMNLNCMANHCG